MIRKPKILILIDYFTPAFRAGGPIRSVSNIVNTQANSYSFFIITSSFDIGNVPLKNITPDIWIKKEFGFIIYCSKGKEKKIIYKEIKKEYNSIYINGMYSFNYSILPLIYFKTLNIESKIIICPRGMLGEESLNIKKTKKIIFLKLANLLRLYNKICWQATSKNEKQNIEKNILGDKKIESIQNIIRPLTDKNLKPLKKIRGKLNIVFYSRILPIKNLDFLLRIISISKRKTDVKIFVYGVEEDKKYLKDCLEYSINKGIQISYLGAIKKHQEIINVLSKYHLFVLPTKHENYGHVIYEALASGCPVLISDKTPWKNLESQGVGKVLNLKNVEKWVEIIEQYLDMNQEDIDIIRKRCSLFSKKILELNSSQKLAYKKLFEKNK